MGNIVKIINVARINGAEEERQILREIIDNTSFAISSLEVLEESESSEAMRAVSSYGRLLMRVIDERSAVNTEE